MILTIIQARMGSSRLPGKVLMPIVEKTILEHLLHRLQPSKMVNHFIVATTTNPEDDAIQIFCENHGIHISRGSDWNVLERFYNAALSMKAASGDTIVRICCDNPLHSYKVMDEVIEIFQKWGVDYCSNSNHEPHFLEDGFDVEVTSFDALQYAHEHAELMSEREHVMPFIKNSGLFRLGWKKTNADYTFKFSVDTIDDLTMVQSIFEKLGHIEQFGINEVTELILSNPGMLKINASSTINSGYQKSLKEDKKIK
jgi:spore coat polysaccharide biosynthesis protein SpsF (cytidylyltransferase family)